MYLRGVEILSPCSEFLRAPSIPEDGLPSNHFSFSFLFLNGEWADPLIPSVLALGGYIVTVLAFFLTTERLTLGVALVSSYRFSSSRVSKSFLSVSHFMVLPFTMVSDYSDLLLKPQKPHNCGLVTLKWSPWISNPIYMG